MYSVSISGDINEISSGEKATARVASLSVSAVGKMAYLKDDPSHPAEIYVASTDGSNEIQVTNLDEEFTDEFWFGTPAGLSFKSFDGLDVQGWIVKPREFDPLKKYPAILCVHGGPHGMFGYNYDERAHLFAGAGYVVIMVDPRGSSGYGQKFSDGCVVNWGGGDYQDLMAGVDYAIDSFSFIDEKRLGVTGGSYGGYMTNWIVTQTHRFKAAVSRACVSNLLTFYGTSMKFSLVEQEFNGLPYDNLNLLAQWSPITHAKKVKTPILFLHGEVDYTCPISESEEMFRAVKRMGVDTRLVRYQGEGHGISKKPSNKIDFYQRHLDWFSKYLR